MPTMSAIALQKALGDRHVFRTVDVDGITGGKAAEPLARLEKQREKFAESAELSSPGFAHVSIDRGTEEVRPARHAAASRGGRSESDDLRLGAEAHPERLFVVDERRHRERAESGRCEPRAGEGAERPFGGDG